MTSAFHRLTTRLIRAALAFCLGLCLLLSPLGLSAEASRSSMTGDYAKDTISVAINLRQKIEVAQDADEQKETISLITDYISRYRNRSQVNASDSFTTMQTALNSLAGHYKTFSSRPLPDELKARLDKELSKAQSIVQKET